jgi:hypothetical protein
MRNNSGSPLGNIVCAQLPFEILKTPSAIISPTHQEGKPEPRHLVFQVLICIRRYLFFNLSSGGERPTATEQSFTITQFFMQRLRLAYFEANQQSVEIQLKPVGVYATREISIAHPVCFVPDSQSLFTRKEGEDPTKFSLRMGANLFVEIMEPKKGNDDDRYQEKKRLPYVNIFSAVRTSAIAPTCNMEIGVLLPQEGATSSQAGIPVMRPSVPTINPGEELVCFLDQIFFFTPAKKNTGVVYRGPKLPAKKCKTS